MLRPAGRNVLCRAPRIPVLRGDTDCARPGRSRRARGAAVDSFVAEDIAAMREEGDLAAFMRLRIRPARDTVKVVALWQRLSAPGDPRRLPPCLRPDDKAEADQAAREAMRRAAKERRLALDQETAQKDQQARTARLKSLVLPVRGGLKRAAANGEMRTWQELQHKTGALRAQGTLLRGAGRPLGAGRAKDAGRRAPVVRATHRARGPGGARHAPCRRSATRQGRCREGP